MKRIWITKDKKHIKIKDMTTSHIQNCINMIEAYYKKMEHVVYLSGYRTLSSLHGEMAIQSVEDELCSLEENGYEEERLNAYLEAFHFELSKRKQLKK